MAVSAIENLRFDALRGKHLLVALSGGADSVALFNILLSRKAKDGFSITCAHLHHGIRGEEADADLAFCRNICENAGVELIPGFSDVPAIAKDRHLGIETAARIERYRFLNEAKEKCSADLIALAHHADDQAETVLMHLLRGAGPEGIAAMPMLSGDKFRPLIGIRKRELVEFLMGNGISWREDGTNTIADTPRNSLRLNVLPEIEKSYPSSAVAIGRYARSAAVESDFLARLTDDFLNEHLEKGPYGCKIRFSEFPEEAILRRAIRRICGDRLESTKLDELISIAQKQRGKTQIFSDLDAEKTPAGLYFLRKDTKIPEKVPVAIPMDVRFGSFYRIAIEEGCAGIDRDDPFSETLNAAALDGACIRVREDGDRIHPLGAKGSRLLSDYLTDKKVDRPVRNCLPVIAKGKNILWVGGHGISENARINQDTAHCVRIKIYFNTDEKAEEEA